METIPDTLSKSEFAAYVNTTPSRLSHWISDGKIGPAAIEGTGRFARIRVAVAVEMLRARRDIGQGLGNGAGVKLPPHGAAAPPLPLTLPDTPPASPPGRGEAAQVEIPPVVRPEWLDPLEEQIKREKLDEIARRNRIAAAREEEAAGRYIEAAAARREMARIAGGMLQVLEQALDTFATAVAEHSQVPQRDILHLLKQEFRKIRERAAAAHLRQAEALPRTSEAADEIETAVDGEGSGVD